MCDPCCSPCGPCGPCGPCSPCDPCCAPFEVSKEPTISIIYSDYLKEVTIISLHFILFRNLKKKIIALLCATYAADGAYSANVSSALLVLTQML